MSNRFTNPRPQFFNSTPVVYSGGLLYFYASSTSTPLATYSDATLSTANTNPVVLNSAGRPDVDIFLSDAAYKVTLKDSAGTTIWTVDPYSTSDYSASAQFITYAGNPNGHVAGTAGSGTIQSDAVWDRTNNILYICTTTGTASTAVWTAVNATAAVQAVPAPQGRLTPTSATPVITTEVTAGTTIYYTPYTGNLVPIYNGVSTLPVAFSELSLTLASQHTLNAIFDVFVFSNSGVPTLVTGPAWSNSTAASGARGTGAGTTQHTRVNGYLVNSVQLTGRNGSTTYTVAANYATYVGSILIDGTAGQVTCHNTYGQSRKWGVWNAYNRVPVLLKAGDGTASWNYVTSTIRQSNAATGNAITVFSGLADDQYEFEFVQKIIGGSTTGSVNIDVAWEIGIGLNSTTAFTGTAGSGGIAVAGASVNAQPVTTLVARYIAVPALGINTFNMLERGTVSSGASVTINFKGTETNMLMSARWMA